MRMAVNMELSMRYFQIINPAINIVHIKYCAQRSLKDVTNNSIDLMYGETFYSRHTAETTLHTDGLM
jgi:hypothetical protein